MTVTVKVLIPAKTAGMDNPIGCWNWTGFKSRDGYGIVHTGNKLLKAHRVAYCEANHTTLAEIKNVVIRHSCDNRQCLNPAHLLPGSSADNTQDRHKRNRDAKGSTNGNSKLTESQVQIIRTQYENYGKKVLAAQYGVSVSLISQIVRKDIWKHV